MPEGPLGFQRLTSMGPFVSKTDCEKARDLLSDIVDITDVFDEDDKCIIHFKLPLAPKRELPSAAEIEGETVTNSTVRFPVTERKPGGKLTPDTGNWESNGVIRDGYYNEHIMLTSDIHILLYKEGLKYMIEMYEDEFDMTDRVREEDMF